VLVDAALVEGARDRHNEGDQTRSDAMQIHMSRNSPALLFQTWGTVDRGDRCADMMAVSQNVIWA
jgi:hypothetical protein